MPNDLMFKEMRDQKVVCASCRYLEPESKTCRLNPPQPVVVGKKILWLYPIVEDPCHQWCGKERI